MIEPFTKTGYHENDNKKDYDGHCSSSHPYRNKIRNKICRKNRSGNTCGQVTSLLTTPTHFFSFQFGLKTTN